MQAVNSNYSAQLKQLPKLLVIGHGRHGKDSVGEILRKNYGLSFVSSSEFAAEKAIYPLVSDIYVNWQEAYLDRHNHRDMWFHAIRAYNLRPGPMLAEQMLEDHDLYVGMRSRDELERSRHVFDAIVWVDASERLPCEPGSSMELTKEDADFVIDNNKPESELTGSVADFLVQARFA